MGALCLVFVLLCITNALSSLAIIWSGKRERERETKGRAIELKVARATDKPS